MRQIILSTLLILCALCGISDASADERSRGILDAMISKIAGYTSYEVEFTATMGGRGRLIVSGDKYYIDVNDYELFFDGHLRYTYSYYDDEVVIEENDPQDNNLLSNPSRFFRLSDDDFSHKYQAPTGADSDRATETVQLTPKKKNASYRSITLHIDPATDLPASIIYHGDGDGAMATIRIDRFIPNVKTSAATFTFDKTQYPDAEVIDFRRSR